MSDVDITVAICSHNRTEGLRECLESLLAQETGGFFSFEIVVVHTGSPGTPELIEKHSQSSKIVVRGFEQAHGGGVTARNRAIREAHGQWIAQFDDDQIAEPQWLRELWLVAQQKNSKSVGGLLHLRLPDGCDREFTEVCRRMLGGTVLWNSVQPYTRQEGPGSGNQMIHRSVFDEVGFYDESFTLRGYDTDMYRRIRAAGIESWFSPKAAGFHVIPSSRLTDAFFKETALHNGWSFARRDCLENGVGFLLMMAVLRTLQAVIINVPRLCLRILLGRKEQILDGRIRLWRAAGYLRSALYLLFPRCFPQSRFFEKYEFRAEKRFPNAKNAACDSVAGVS